MPREVAARRLRYGPEAMAAAAHARERFEKNDRLEESGRGQPHSKTWRTQFDRVPRGSVRSAAVLCRFVSRGLTKTEKTVYQTIVRGSFLLAQSAPVTYMRQLKEQVEEN
jgi:hypothetical protein